VIDRSRFLRLCVGAVLAAALWPVHAQQVFRITAIPDESPTELARKAAPLIKYLERQLGMKVEWTPVTDYAASVEALVNRKVDMAWFGGFTFVQANVRSGGKVIPIAQREEDERFRSVFITSDASIKSLADLKGKDVSFGSQSSTSGHLMPRSFLLQAGVLRLQLVGACRHAGRAAQEADRCAARPRPRHPRGQGDPRVAARHAFHPEQGRELQGHRSGRAQRQPVVAGRVVLRTAESARWN
jgi:ABC-type phosphate/phosphonate transport system substrate-binding protein